MHILRNAWCQFFVSNIYDGYKKECLDVRNAANAFNLNPRVFRLKNYKLTNQHYQPNSREPWITRKILQWSVHTLKFRKILVFPF